MGHDFSVTGRIAFEGVRFTYPARPNEAALDGVDLNIEPGETVAFVGPSGAGKTTVINAVAGLINPTSGHISLDDTVRKHSENIFFLILILKGSTFFLFPLQSLKLINSTDCENTIRFFMSSI